MAPHYQMSSPSICHMRYLMRVKEDQLNLTHTRGRIPWKRFQPAGCCNNCLYGHGKSLITERNQLRHLATTIVPWRTIIFICHIHYFNVSMFVTRGSFTSKMNELVLRLPWYYSILYLVCRFVYCITLIL